MNKKQRRLELMKKISDHKQTMWIWIIVAILFCWTIVGLFVGIIGAIWAHELKSNKEIELASL